MDDTLQPITILPQPKPVENPTKTIVKRKPRISADDPSKPLTWMQSVFVRYFTAIGQPTWDNAAASARAAGFKGNPRVLAVTASRLLTRANIQAAIRQEIDNALGAAGIDLQWWVREGITRYKAAIEAGDRAVARQYWTDLGRYFGAYAEDNRQRSEVLQILLR